jgi:hypothetical protein
MIESETTMISSIKRVFSLGLLLGVGIAAGCAENKKPAADSFFPPRDGSDQLTQTFQAMVTAGAREDATLRPFHFDGPELNSAGVDKLSRMISGDSNAEVLVFMAIPAGEYNADRREAVSKYLKEQGVEAAHIKLETGANPKTDSPSDAGLTRLSKTESGTAGGFGETGSGSASSSSGSSMSGSK